MTDPPPRILISAGEASSDMYAARLAAALRARTGASFFGFGGPRMRAAGVDIVVDNKEVAVMGITEVVKKIPAVIRVQNRLRKEAARRGAKMGILVNSPGMNLGVGRRLKNDGVPVIYFIGPQVWAWRPGRVRIIRRLVKKILLIFPFEEKIYRDAGVPAEFVGHPLVDSVRAGMPRDAFFARHKLDPNRSVVALLPGSRPAEISRHLPVLVAATEQLQQELNPQFLLAAAPGIEASFWTRYFRPGSSIQIIADATYDVLAAADCAVVSSGTATVEAAILETPMVVVYRVSPPTAAILKRMLRTPHIAMVNLIAGERVVPELIQNAFSEQAVVAEVRRLLLSPEARAAMKARLRGVRQKLGPPGAIARAADSIAQML